MVKKVVFSAEANENLKNTIEYLVENWSIKYAQKFIMTLDKKIKSIKLFPYSYPQIPQKEIHKCVVTKQISLYYRIKQDCLEIVTVFDSRQDEKKLEL